MTTKTTKAEQAAQAAQQQLDAARAEVKASKQELERIDQLDEVTQVDLLKQANERRRLARRVKALGGLERALEKASAELAAAEKADAAEQLPGMRKEVDASEAALDLLLTRVELEVLTQYYAHLQRVGELRSREQGCGAQARRSPGRYETILAQKVSWRRGLDQVSSGSDSLLGLLLGLHAEQERQATLGILFSSPPPAKKPPAPEVSLREAVDAAVEGASRKHLQGPGWKLAEVVDEELES